jgi:hypothetical protein
MRRVFNGVARGVVVVAVVVSMASPAEAARTREAGGEVVKKDRPSVVQMIKKMVVRAFGDTMSIPKP